MTRDEIMGELKRIHDEGHVREGDITTDDVMALLGTSRELALGYMRKMAKDNSEWVLLKVQPRAGKSGAPTVWRKREAENVSETETNPA